MKEKIRAIVWEDPERSQLANQLLAMAEEACRRKPDSASAWKNLAQVCEKGGGWSRAEEAFAHWIELEPDAMDAKAGWVRALLKNHRYEKVLAQSNPQLP
ncbi:MAG: tetratricopeptide repeat protein, partial [Planctomycetota bacterium]